MSSNLLFSCSSICVILVLFGSVSLCEITSTSLLISEGSVISLPRFLSRMLLTFSETLSKVALPWVRLVSEAFSSVSRLKLYVPWTSTSSVSHDENNFWCENFWSSRKLFEMKVWTYLCNEKTEIVKVFGWFEWLYFVWDFSLVAGRSDFKCLS